MIHPLSLIAASALFSVVVLTACDSDPILAGKYSLCRFTPNAEAMDNSAVVSGKVLVIYKSSNFEKEKYGECDLDGYGEKGFRIDPVYFPAEMYAKSPEEIDTLILIENKKGEYLDSAIVRHSLERKSDVRVYRGITEISMINYKTSTVIRKTRKENAGMPKQIPENRLKLDRTSMNYEYVIEPSVDDIRTASREFSNQVKSSP